MLELGGACNLNSFYLGGSLALEGEGGVCGGRGMIPFFALPK